MSKRSNQSSDRLLGPLAAFVRHEASSGIVLLLCAGIAVILANSQVALPYSNFWTTQLTTDVSPRLIVNDGLMAVFFLLVGIEIKREVVRGELSSFKRASLPVVAAVGGMIVPALVYGMLNFRGLGARGWGIPMATDIAFALGVLALFGSRVPFGLKVLLTAIAIVDDLGAVLVIAVFYSGSLNLIHLAIALGCSLVIGGLAFAKVKHPGAYILPGIGLWLSLLGSGIHATLAGVVLAFLMPADEEGPAGRIEHVIEPWVAYLIVPLFALANAGVGFGGVSALIENPVGGGVLLGLVLGKPIGIFVFSFMAVKYFKSELPGQVAWRDVLGIGLLGGIGFTMSIFVTELAFPDPALRAVAKQAILAASVAAGILGYLCLRRPAARQG